MEPKTQPLGLEPLLSKLFAAGHNFAIQGQTTNIDLQRTVGGPKFLKEDQNFGKKWSHGTIIFNENFGPRTKIFRTNIPVTVQPGVAPKFCKPRSVPFATKQAVEDELDRLESSGILEKVSYSEWAAPIVVVPKKDGKIHLCDDYKVTVNSALEVDQYPLPRPDDLFATLAGGTKFTTLEMSQAYLQLVLDEDSASYVTVNTHRGLYRYTRLPFGIASAPAMFQKVMDTILQDIPNVICYIDDILVTGADDQAHLRNLAEVFARLERHGIRMKKGKCLFMRNSVEYLGHRVDATGLHALPDNWKPSRMPPSQRMSRSYAPF